MIISDFVVVTPLHQVRAKPEHHKFLIGVKGANIKSVREETGARIIFPTEKDTDREAIIILGTKEAVAQAKKKQRPPWFLGW